MKKVLFLCFVTAFAIVAFQYFRHAPRPPLASESIVLKNYVTSNMTLNDLPPKREIEPGPVVTIDKVPSLKALIEKYQSKSEDELRLLIKEANLLADRKKLYERSNAGLLTESESQELAYNLRLNTALYKLILERELQ